LISSDELGMIIGASSNVVATVGSLLLHYWTLGYSKTAFSHYEHIVA